jgi:16S rRNA (guanine527-N7)-methyltransferase
LGVPLAEEGRSKLARFIALIGKWNQVYNLTAVRDASHMVSVHLLDSLAAVPHIAGPRLLDVGSGAGLPGIPIAVARPEIQVTLLDSSHKKAAFLRQAVAELQLRNARVVCERVESWRPPGTFDCIISRAYAEMAEFVTSSLHLLSPDGFFAAMKGLFPFEEIDRLPANFRVSNVIRLEVPQLTAERHLVLIKAI